MIVLHLAMWEVRYGVDMLKLCHIVPACLDFDGMGGCEVFCRNPTITHSNIYIQTAAPPIHLDHSRERSKLYNHIFVKALYKHTWQGRLSRVMVHIQRQPNCTLCVCWHLWLTHSGNTKSRRIVRFVVLHIETLVKYILCLANKLLFICGVCEGMFIREMCAACNM